MANNFSGMMPIKNPNSEIVPWRTLIISGIIFGIVLVVSAILSWGYKPFLESSIKKSETRIAELDSTAPQAETESRFVQFYSQLSNINVLLLAHTSLMPVFNAFENNTMEKVGFVNMTIDLEEKEIDTDGFTDSFETLAGQLSVYENLPNINKVTLFSSVLTDNLVRFQMQHEFSSEFFKFIPVIEQPTDEPIEQIIDQPIEQSAITPNTQKITSR